MNDIVKLETSIHKFIDEFKGLREERDNVIKEAEMLKMN